MIRFADFGMRIAIYKGVWLDRPRLIDKQMGKDENRMKPDLRSSAKICVPYDFLREGRNWQTRWT